MVGGEGGEHGQAPLREPVHPAPQHRVDQQLLRPEVVVDRGDVGAGRGVDRPHRHRVDPALREEPLGGVEQALGGLGSGGAGVDQGGGHGPTVRPSPDSIK